MLVAGRALWDMLRVLKQKPEMQIVPLCDVRRKDIKGSGNKQVDV